MKICRLEIKGFRGINSGCINLGDFTVLIGQGNSGKTTIIEALALLLGRDKLVKNLTEHDFFGSSPTADSRILIIATIA
ncbi:MAG: AAA family ATPase, partial [Verrucomicrobia bacterium]|nr:AAA family ATPase [Verrucomicrobiota bacterium]